MFFLHAAHASVMNALEPSNLSLRSLGNLDAIPILQTPRVSFVSSIEIVMLFSHAQQSHCRSAPFPVQCRIWFPIFLYLVDLHLPFSRPSSLGGQATFLMYPPAIYDNWIQ